MPYQGFCNVGGQKPDRSRICKSQNATVKLKVHQTVAATLHVQAASRINT